MTSVQQSLAILMLLAFVSQTGADVRWPTPGVSVDVLHQQDGDQPEGLEEEEDEDEEDEEPDCE